MWTPMTFPSRPSRPDCSRRTSGASRAKRRRVKHDPAALGRRAVIVGTLGHSPLVDRLAANGKLDISAIKGKWESFVLQTVANPLPNVASALVIAGSDRRGTAYGALELSEQVGVGPWVWWADVAPTHRDALSLKAGTFVVGPPSVKYRGIFINDEDWGLQPWAAKTFDPKFGNIGPKTYEKLFELLLRLKANYLWPAMHPVSTEFGTVDENSKLADRWGIVMGASHAEPMNRNNVHWNGENRGEWRYDTNKARIDQYWEEWAKKRGLYEAVWSVGMRGIHDSGMIGPRDIHERVAILQNAIAGQRSLLAKYVNPDVTKVPQAFMPYKEALAQYQAGLKLPADITLVWCDDNYGFIRQLGTPAEQKRSGGSGVYYHVSYLGRPKPYLWIDTTPPALIWQQMTTAAEFGADRVWVLNVGDLKGCELGMEFWTKLAWKTDRWGPDAQKQFLREWAARDFGEPFAADIAALMGEFYQLGFQRKPELMETDAFSATSYSEARDRLAAYRKLLDRADKASEQLPAEKRDGFYELVLYPVQVAAKTNEAFLAADLSRLAASQLRPAANQYADEAKAAHAAIERDTDHYNNSLVGGKWRDVMTLTGMKATGEYARWGPEWFIQWPAGETVAPSNRRNLGIAIDGRATPLIAGVDPADAYEADLDWSPAEGRVPPPWRAVGEGESRAVVVPNGPGNTLDPRRATPLKFNFTVKRPGAYHLFAKLAVPTQDDDSFFVRLDGGPWATWNDIAPTDALAWREQGTHALSAGRHTLEIANREDGAGLGRVRLTPRPAADRPADSPYGAPSDQLPTFADTPGRRSVGLRLFHADGTPVEGATVKADAPWVKVADVRPSAKSVGNERPYDVSVDWRQAPKGYGPLTATLAVAADGETQSLKVRAVRVPTDGSFAQIDGAVSIEAEHFNRSAKGGPAGWVVIPGLGRTGPGAVTVRPATVPSLTTPEAIRAAAPSLSYDVNLSAAGEVAVRAYCLPTHPLTADRRLRFAVSFDDQPPAVVDFAESGGRSGEGTAEWLKRTTRNIAVVETKHRLAAPGRHTLHLWMADPGVVVDKLVIDAGGALPSALGPPETR